MITSEVMIRIDKFYAAIKTLKASAICSVNNDMQNESDFNKVEWITGENSNGTAILSSNPSDFGITWSEIATAIEDGGTLAMMQLRKERDKKIAESDWRAVGDRTLPDAWKTYRQQLRDLPNSLPTNKKPKLVWDNNKMYYVISNVTWPTEPSE